MDPRDPRYQEWLAQQGQQQPQQQQQVQPQAPPIYGWGPDQQQQQRPPQAPPQANWPPQAPPPQAAGQRPIYPPPSQGYDPYADDAQVRMMRDAHRSSGHRMMITGGIIALVGIIITAATYSSASEGGGTYII